MCTRYRDEIRDGVRVYLHGLGRVEDAKSIGENTSMEKLRERTSFSSIEAMYSHFNHKPYITNPEGNPCDMSPTPCYLLFGETSVKVSGFKSSMDLIRHIGIDYGTHESINNSLRNGGCRLHIGKYVFAITRRNTTAIESIPISKNNRLNIKIAAKIIGGIPNTCISMYDIAKHVGVETGKGLSRRLCEYFGIEYHKTNALGNPDTMPRHTALTNTRTREVFEFASILEASKYLRVNDKIVSSRCSRRETIPFYGDRYSIDIDYTD